MVNLARLAVSIYDILRIVRATCVYRFLGRRNSLEVLRLRSAGLIVHCCPLSSKEEELSSRFFPSSYRDNLLMIVQERKKVGD